MTLLVQTALVTPELRAILWRDAELLRTDIAATVSDYPNAAAIITYRAALRDWPSRNEAGDYTNGFPATRPVIGE